MAGTSSAQKRQEGQGANRRTDLIKVRVTPAEKRQALALASSAGVQLSTFARARILTEAAGQGIKDPSRRSPRVQSRDELVRSLTAIGNNLNQIARVANSTGEIRRGEQLEEAIAALMAKVPEIK